MDLATLLFIFYFLLGAAAGSFLNVWADRLLKGKPPTGRSRCDRCGRVLGALDLIPLFSFAALRGRCRYCGEPLSWQHPIVEVGTGLLFALLARAAGYDALFTVPLLIAAGALLAVFLTDLKDQVIFDQMLWAAGAGALLYRLLIRLPAADYLPLFYDLTAAAGVWAFFQAVRLLTKKRGMGEGDLPLGFVIGVLAGFPLVLLTLFLAFVSGGIAGVTLIALGRSQLKDRIAFGPFLIGALFFSLLFGAPILDWYLGFLGL